MVNYFNNHKCVKNIQNTQNNEIIFCCFYYTVKAKGTKKFKNNMAKQIR